MPKGKTDASPTAAPTAGNSEPIEDEVTVECWENHRYFPFNNNAGWGPTKSGLDRPAWTTKKGDKVMCRESFLLPVGWSWTGSWNVEPHKDNMEGWYYGPDFSISTKYCSSKASKLSMVRRRKWVRTRRNCQAELEMVASVRSMRMPTTTSPRGSYLSQASDASTWMNVPEPKVFVPEFCFRYSTWTNTATYGFSGASDKALAAEQERCHNSFIRLHGLLASTEFFDNHTGSTGLSDLATASLSATPFSPQGHGLGSHNDLAALSDGDASPTGNAQRRGSSVATSAAGGGAPSSPYSPPPPLHQQHSSPLPPPHPSSSSSSRAAPIQTRVPEKILSTVYKYGVAPVLRRHLWVSWSGAGAKKAANGGLFQRLAKEAVAIMEKGHQDGTNEMLAEILQDVVRTAPRHPFFEHSQVLSLMRSKKTLASPQFSPVRGVGGVSASSPSSPTMMAGNQSIASQDLGDGYQPVSNASNANLGASVATASDSHSSPASPTTLSGAIANNNIANHTGGFVNDNSGSYRLTLVLVCLSLYEKEQAAYKASIDKAMAAATAAAAADTAAEGSEENTEAGVSEGIANANASSSATANYKKVPEYHQAFSYMAALLLLNMPEEEAFWTLVCLLEDFLPVGYHDAFQMHTDLRVLNEVIRERLPQLDANFSRHQVDMSVFASGWLQGLFCAHFPFTTAARILDVLFAEGNSSILVRVIFAFMRLYKVHFVNEDSSCGAGQFANNWARECYDLDEVMATVANDQKSLDLMNVVEHRRRDLYSNGGGNASAW